jgi:uncharacterized membrane protein
MHKILTTLVLLGVTAHGSQEQEPVQEDPATREQEPAKNNVWHAAKLRGVAFRAIGQEPGWLLEITNGEEILLVTDYGKNKQSYRYVEPQEDKAARKTVFPVDIRTSVLIEGKPCTDSMSGESSEVTVTVMLGEKKLKGCGRALF